MTLEQYIANPMGKNNAVMNASAREIQRQHYKKKFDNILLRENGKIDYKLFIDSKNNTYWVYIKVPSEFVKNFYYDVVLKFIPNEKTPILGENLFKCDVEFFSNDPAFVFTYAHVFLTNNIFIKELVSKMSKEAVKEVAKEKNPNNVVGYVKAIYFAYLVMENKKLNKKSRFEAESTELSLAYLLASIEDADEKIRKRQEENVSKKKKVVVDKRTANRIKHIIGRDADLSNSKLQIRTTNKINSIKNKSSVKSTKSVGSIKKK